MENIIDKEVMEAIFLTFAIVILVFIGTICAILSQSKKYEMTLKSTWHTLNYHLIKLKNANDQDLKQAISSAYTEFYVQKCLIAEELNIPMRKEFNK
jgi:hypothetical protein